ncbi:DUF1365 domain-containing protein [Massilia atriviolacea]|uniref:DUF1365 domain-containing protein n=1 Tax=Massilia atriviolacea TaxID=2495579 RepID=A0A430HM34_9BURK|nr:DUF1365 domain-containing protein [Massilia atriviolacea]RSZ58595.1 DUF1365 domain-containing protein [Massilia atriviolacea]
MQRPDPAPEPRAQLCFGQVRHTRLRPVVNAFAYATYYVRLPLRAIGTQRFGCALFSRNRFNLLSFADADHGDGKQPLVDWIDALLLREGITDADGEVWLQTMPRVLGYVFNPVSFWFCHRRDGALRALVCDVRNTFGERHFYLLDTGADIANGQELRARKVFHVSPFCQVQGGYRFRFTHLLRMNDGRAQDSTLACIDYDDADGPLLQTSLSGNAVPITSGSVARAFFGFPLMTAGVVARIHLQALRLWLRRVPFFSKPTPPQHKVTR